MTFDVTKFEPLMDGVDLKVKVLQDRTPTTRSEAVPCS